MSNIWGWIKSVLTLLWNIRTLTSAWKNRPVFGSEGYWVAIKSWLTDILPTITKITKETPTEWDDKITDALYNILYSTEGMSEVQTVMTSASLGNNSQDTEQYTRLRDRFRARLLSRRSAQSDVSIESCYENAEDLSTAVMIISMISSSVSFVSALSKIRTFIKKRRESRLGAGMEAGNGDE